MIAFTFGSKSFNRAYFSQSFIETRMVINEDGELATCKSDGIRKVCETCGEDYYKILTSKIDLPPDLPKKS